MVAMVAVIWMLPLAASAAPPPVKVGWIDLQRTLSETRVGKAAKTRLEAEKDAKQKQINEKKEKLQKQADELEKKKVLMEADAYNNSQRQLQEQYVQLQQLFVQLQQDLAKSEAQLTKDIFMKASTIIDDIARRDGYTMIIEKNEGAVLWADKTYDITDEVNRRLDAGEGKTTVAPKAAPPKGGKK